MFYLWGHLKATNKPIVLYGMGNGADLIINELQKLNINIRGVFASDGFVRNKLFKGFTVCDYKTIKAGLGDIIILVAFGTARQEVINNILNISNENELYIPDVPVYGDTIFNKQFIKENATKIRTVYNMLADDKSKKIYESIISFKAGGRPADIISAETDYSEDFKLLKLNNNEIYLDLGAFNGDTVLLFNSLAGGYKKIIALEPDIKSFNRLINNTAYLNNIQYINKGIWNKADSIPFLIGGGRNTAAGKGKTQLDVTSVDEILKGEQVTFIKMDVEGSEAKAIEGAQNTINKFKPKMQIACYHRSEDIFDLPLKVAELRDDYKLYIRHQPCFPAWDTNFYFV